MDNIYILVPLIILGIIVVFGIPIYGIMKFYDSLKGYADSRIVKILVRAKLISAPINKNDIMLYSVYGFLNITTEYRLTVYANYDNYKELKLLAKELKNFSYKMSFYTLRIHGIFLIWYNYRKLDSKLSQMES